MKESRPRGRPRKPDSQAFSVRLPVELHQELRYYAVYARQSLNEILVEAVTKWWEANPDREKFHRAAIPFPRSLKRT